MTLNSILYAPIYFLGCLYLVEGGSFSFWGAYPAGFRLSKAVTNCFWPRKVGHINGLFVLEDESSGCILRCRKIKTNGRMECRVSASSCATLSADLDAAATWADRCYALDATRSSLEAKPVK